MSLERDLREERAAGGIVSRSGDIATMGNGEQWWLNGTEWARAEADAGVMASRRDRQPLVYRRA